MIQTSKLTKILRSEIVYPDIDISLWDFVIINGPSWIGKTSLLKVLVWLDTNFRWNFTINSNNIYYYFQDFGLLENLSVYENLKIASNKWKEEINKILIELWLYWYENRSINQLSSWEYQRLCVSRVFLNNPEILVLDEPTSNLDNKNRYIVNEKLIESHKLGNTILLCTHSIEDFNYFKSNIDNSKLQILTLW